MKFKQWFKELFCVLFKHKWETVDWIYDSKKLLSCRKDKCKRCSRELILPDLMAANVIAFKKQVWLESRRVIVEKHKNPKEYKMMVAVSKGDEPYLVKDEVFILDEKIEAIKKEIQNICIINGIYSAEIICVDEPEIPEELKHG